MGLLSLIASKHDNIHFLFINLLSLILSLCVYGGFTINGIVGDLIVNLLLEADEGNKYNLK